jgi:hypothetical protein
VNKGFVILVQNNSDVDYVRMAAYLAASIKRTQKTIKSVSVITDDVNLIKDSYKDLFDNVIEIPWNDSAKNSLWKIENRWKIYHATPYDQTIMLDADMLFLSDIEHWWEYLDRNFDLCITTDVKTYRGETVTGDFYRRAFTANGLPNTYTAFVYFKKTNFSKQFWELVEEISKNWQQYYKHFLKEHRPNFLSMDVVFALAVKILDIEDQVTSTISHPTFVHMKGYIQDWDIPHADWMKKISVDLDRNLNLKIGNFLQKEIFHYTEKKFVDIIERSEFIKLGD